MKNVILSRKGFDSAAGGGPSPILRDGRIFSIPIPQKYPSHHRYSDLTFDEFSGEDLLQAIPHKGIDTASYCHRDPALSESIGLLGQVSTSQSELRNNSVGIGDLFLFFGWFREVDLKSGSGCHHLFGWLQVKEIISGNSAIKEYLDTSGQIHPHSFGDEHGYKNNTLYISHGYLEGENRTSERASFGRFRKRHKELTLTEPGQPRSHWLLPGEFFSTSQKPFKNRLTWSDPECPRIAYKGYGQEFILDAEKHRYVEDWATSLIEKFGR